MADFEYAKFTNEAISLDGNTYEGCTFTDCELIIEASAPFSLANNDFTRCLWTFTGAAAAWAGLQQGRLGVPDSNRGALEARRPQQCIRTVHY